MLKHHHTHKRRGYADAETETEILKQLEVENELDVKNGVNVENEIEVGNTVETELELNERQVAQVYSTVYVYYTESATFTGQTAALLTQTRAQDQTTKAATTTAKPATTESAKANSILVATSSSQPVASVKSSSSASVILPGTSVVSSSLSIVIAPSSTAALIRTGSASSTTSSPTAISTTPASLTNNDTGMSTGSKVGIAVGSLLGLGALISLLIFCFRRKKRQANAERLEDEKTFNGDVAAFGATRSASTRTARTASAAPRLSLRPVTQFSPNLATQNGNAMAMTTINEKEATLGPKSAWERPSTSASQDVHNPFGNHAEIQPAGSPVVATGPGGPHTATPYAAVPAVIELSAIAGTAERAGSQDTTTNANTIGLARGASKRENRPQQLDLTKVPPVSAPAASTDVPLSAGGASIAAAGGPQNSTVHRVQLDFKPSMEDELELKAGQLIRKLMDYDDGWCLCIRLDRSEQGVVPRTCLSSLPVKPRPAPPRNGPPPPGYRGGPPRPGSAQSNRGPQMRPGSAQGNRNARGPNFQFTQGPPRPGSAQSNRAPNPVYIQGPPRPGSAQSDRSYGSPNPHFAQQQPRPSSANSSRTVFPGAPGYNQSPQNYNPNIAANTAQKANQIPDADREFYHNQRELNDLERAHSPAPLKVPNRDGEGHLVMTSQGQGHQSGLSVDRKPVPGMAL